MAERMIRQLPGLPSLRNAAAAGLLLLSALLFSGASPPAAAAEHGAWHASTALPAVKQAGFNLHGLAGLPVYAIDPGLVRFAGYRKGLGQIVDIDQPNGFSTRYAHLNRLLVHPGQSVALHQEIGLVGDTGWALWPRQLSEVSFSATP